jgi:hypothetical protein
VIYQMFILDLPTCFSFSELYFLQSIQQHTLIDRHMAETLTMLTQPTRNLPEPPTPTAVYRIPHPLTGKKLYLPVILATNNSIINLIKLIVSQYRGCDII